ncbi:MAG: hypothetical protein ACRDYF_04305 [Acidimicrobiia bacterium]
MGSRPLEVADAFEANELFGRKGWTDGLPIVPPTPELVRQSLEAALLQPDSILGVEPVRGLVITAEKVAVNAVMAGCRPEDLPVVAAAVEAMCEPAYLLHGSAASTGGSALGRRGAPPQAQRQRPRPGRRPRRPSDLRCADIRSR